MGFEKTFIGNEKLEFRQIVLVHIKNILNLSLRSNRDGEKNFLYYNSIEALADVLIPFYDKQMNEKTESFEKRLKTIQEENNAKLKELCQSDYSNQYANIHLAKRKQAFRELFRELNLLLQRNDYLKSSVYGEDKDEVGKDEDDDDNGDEEEEE